MTSSRSGASEVYVALGDSISIDLYAGGPGRGGASLLARNRDVDFPDWRGHDVATARTGCSDIWNDPLDHGRRR